jgi:uncharacterized membrane protein HdeD (DUF308 family)
MTYQSAPEARGTRGIDAVLPRIRVHWWVLLVIGVAWLIFAMAVLQFNLTSALSIAIATGLLLVVAAFSELLNAIAAPGWKWLHAVLAVVFFVMGIIALVWPQSTFLALARIVAWYLLFKGGADIALSLARQEEDRLWWLRLIVGVLEISLAFWAASYPGRSAVLLVLWVGLSALMKGFTDIVLAFEVRSLQTRTPHQPATPQQVPDQTVPGGVATAG